MMRKKKTGIPGLDDMIQGGIPEGRIILLSGGPGSGKTILSIQFLIEGIKQGEKCAYISLEEPLKILKENMIGLGWNLEKHSKDGQLLLVDSSHLVSYQPEKVYLDKTPFIDTLEQLVQVNKIDRLVLDPINSITIQIPSTKEKRETVSKLFSLLRRVSITSIITLEVEPSAQDFYMEKYLADGSIILDRVIDPRFRLITTLRVEKMRGVQCDDQPRTYTIRENGLKVYNTEQVITE
jgi:KaiC/GvpD/RAD55 family RecA-like ATPase